MTSADPTAAPAPFPGPIAYLTGEYPRATDTFVWREVAALRAQGVTVHACSVRRTDAAHIVGDEQRAERAATFYVITAAKNPAQLLGAHLGALRAAPGRWLSALKLAWNIRPPGLKAALWQGFYFLEAGVLAAHLRARGVRHLHNHFGNSSCSVAMLAAEIAGIPFSYTMHGPAIFFEPHKWRIDEKIARAAFVACISHFCRAQGMIFADQAHWDRMRIIHCAVDPAAYAPEPGRAPGEEILFVGRLAAIKGVAVLLEAFARLAPDRPAARLTLVGDGPERKGLEAMAARLGIAGRVTFTGYLSQAEVAARLSRTDVFALPSFAEGVPVVLMEAMAAQAPVIAPRVAGVGELVEDGVSGFTVAPGDPDMLTARLRDLLADPDLRTRMGAAGRKAVIADFEQTAEAARLRALIAGAIAGALPPGLRPDPAVAMPQTPPMGA
jgi:glycosyltransferase involved in cell wall biosynthesis